MNRYRLAGLTLIVATMGLAGCAHQQPVAAPGHYHPHTLHRTYVVPPNYVIGTPRRVVTESHRIYHHNGYLVPSLGYRYSY